MLSTTSLAAMLLLGAYALALGLAPSHAESRQGEPQQDEHGRDDGAEVDASTAPADAATIEAIVTATYDVISGPAGEARDWARFHALFHPTLGRLLASRPRRGEATDGATQELVSMTPADYVERSGPVLEARGFFERELSSRIERFGDIAHVFSTYDSRSTADGEPFARGINSFQLWWDGKRWWVMSVLWCQESSAVPLPERYLEAH